MSTLIEKDLLDGIWKEDGLYVQDNDGSEEKLFSWDEIGQKGEEVLETYLILKEELEETAIKGSLLTFNASIIVVTALQGEESSIEQVKEFAYRFDKKRVELFDKYEPFINTIFLAGSNSLDPEIQALGKLGLNMLVLKEISQDGNKGILKTLTAWFIGRTGNPNYVDSQFINEFSNDIIDNYSDPETFLKKWTKMSLFFTDYLSEIPSSLEYIADFVGESFSNLLSELRDEFHQAEAKKSPLILDLDGDGVETTSLENSVNFDHDNNGFAEKTAWVGKDDGLLVLDRNNDGIINDGGELFGDQTSLKDGTSAGNGFKALAELDSNKDGVINADDKKFKDLKVCQDINGDGFSQSNELKYGKKSPYKRFNKSARGSLNLFFDI